MHSVFYYLWHWLTAVNDHSLQAPFIFDFYNKVLKPSNLNDELLPIESLRQQLMTTRSEIEVESMGAESRVNNNRLRPIADIAKQGITSAQTSLLLTRIIKTYNLKNIIELGSSFGINTMYLAMNAKSGVTTFEGCTNTLDIAKNNFSKLNYENIKSIVGDIDDTLPAYLSSLEHSIDFAYIDANHRYEPTVTYFNLLCQKSNNNSVFVFDDIHWSTEMSTAWQEIQNDPRVTLSIDLFDLGIVFFRPELTKQHYRIRY